MKRSASRHRAHHEAIHLAQLAHDFRESFVPINLSLAAPVVALRHKRLPFCQVKRHLVCKRWTIEKADENSNGIPWFVLHRPNSDKLRFHLPSLPWHWFDA